MRKILLLHVFLSIVCCKSDSPTYVESAAPKDLKITDFSNLFVGQIDSQRILKNVQGTKKGYTLKEIKDISDDSMASVSGQKPNFIMKIHKIGTFTATIVIEHASYGDTTFSKVKFEIQKSATEKLTFKKLIKPLVKNGIFSSENILENIEGPKQGYAIKEINTIKPSDIVTLLQDKKSLKFKKAGTFTATIVLVHPSKQDAKIEKASFSVVSVFDKTFGTVNEDVANCVVQTTDGGYIVAGYTVKSSSNHDYWIMKLDAMGQQLWEKKSGLSYSDAFTSIVKTNDGNYVAAGFITVSGKSANFLARKFDDSGTLIWKKDFGGAKTDKAQGICKTADGGFILVGYTTSSGAGKEDGYVIKLDAQGNKSWEKTFGDSNMNYLEDVVQNSDGTYVAVGRFKKGTYYNGWVMKLNNDGAKVWEKFFNNGNHDRIYAISLVSGGYIVTGDTRKGSYYNMWVMKLNSDGTKDWQKIFGDKNSGSDAGYSVIEDENGNYIVAGSVKSTSNAKDFSVKKLDSQGAVLWEKTFGAVAGKEDIAYQVLQTSDGGFIVVGETESKGAGKEDFWILKLNSEGNLK